jgi:hypothetical protein
MMREEKRAKCNEVHDRNRWCRGVRILKFLVSTAMELRLQVHKGERLDNRDDLQTQYAQKKVSRTRLRNKK